MKNEIEIQKIPAISPCKRCGNTEPLFIDYFNEIQGRDVWWVKCGNSACNNSNGQYSKKETCIERWNFWNAQ